MPGGLFLIGNDQIAAEVFAIDIKPGHLVSAGIGAGSLPFNRHDIIKGNGTHEALAITEDDQVSDLDIVKTNAVMGREILIVETGKSVVGFALPVQIRPQITEGSILGDHHRIGGRSLANPLSHLLLLLGVWPLADVKAILQRIFDHDHVRIADSDLRHIDKPIDVITGYRQRLLLIFQREVGVAAPGWIGQIRFRQRHAVDQNLR